MEDAPEVAVGIDTARRREPDTDLDIGFHIDPDTDPDTGPDIDPDIELDAEPGDEAAFVVVEGCHNFRDAGGWPTVDGRRMRRGRLYRSDDPVRLTPAGRAAVEALGLALVVDLRQDAQFRRSPGFLEPERTAHVALVDRVVDPDDPPCLETATDITDLYEAMIARSREQLRRALAALAAALGRGPVLVHCAFGKDRAGITTALVQAAIGVTPAAIVSEFARSDGPGRRRRAHMMAAPIAGDPPFDALPANLFTAPAATMHELLRRALVTHGSLAAWVATVAEPATVDSLRAALVE